MSGAAWAALSGVGFGLFQALNARAVRELTSVYVSTFLQLLVAFAILALATLATEDLSDLGDELGLGPDRLRARRARPFLHRLDHAELSPSRIGAARTSPLLSTAPLFGLVFAAIFFADLPGAAALGGIALVIGGAYLVSDPGGGQRARLADSGFALATAAAWALSPILTVEGLQELDSPLLGVTIGMLAASLAYGVLLAVTGPAAARLARSSRGAGTEADRRRRRRPGDLGTLGLARRRLGRRSCSPCSCSRCRSSSSSPR